MSEQEPQESLYAEAEGETIREAKWLALRELERRCPGLDRDRVTFEVLAEGERGLLGVGMSPARVVARLARTVEQLSGAPRPATGEVGTPLEQLVRDVLEHVTAAIGASCRVDVVEREDAVAASLSGADVGLVIGRRGRTIDAVQYVTSAIVRRARDDLDKPVVVDAAGYRDRRAARLRALASRAAEQARRTGKPVALEPMSPVERKLVHLSLRDLGDVETRSEGEEPERHVVVVPVDA